MNKDFIFRLVLFCQLLFSVRETISSEQLNMESKNPQKQAIPLKGNIIVSVIYIVDEIDSDLIELMEPIDNAFNLEGRDIYTHIVDKHYFASPFSYPFEFSQNGSTKIIQKLRSFNFIDSNSINEKTFPNIAKHHQGFFDSFELDEFLIEEKYISFKIKNWENIEFMYFPAFLVMKFQYTDNQIKNYKDYQKLKENWHNKIEEFRGLYELRNYLSVNRTKIKWSNKPILVFTSMECSHDVDYLNRYIFGGQNNESRKDKFLKEVSLLKNDDSNGFTSLHQIEGIFHEYSFANIWRLYYSYNPIFRENTNWHISEQSKNSSRNTFIRVLKSAIFCHLIIPYGIDRLKNQNKEIEMQMDGIWVKRSQFINNFSQRDIRRFQIYINSTAQVSKSTNTELKRIEEIDEGIRHIQNYVEDPFQMPINNPNYKITAEEYKNYKESYNKLFHLENESDRTNDLKIIKNSREQFNNLIVAEKNNISTFEKEIFSSRELIENRSNILENKINILLSIFLPALGAIIMCIFLYIYWKFR